VRKNRKLITAHCARAVTSLSSKSQLPFEKGRHVYSHELQYSHIMCDCELTVG
jgi:hypothetical protein